MWNKKNFFKSSTVWWLSAIDLICNIQLIINEGYTIYLNGLFYVCSNNNKNKININKFVIEIIIQIINKIWLFFINFFSGFVHFYLIFDRQKLSKKFHFSIS